MIIGIKDYESKRIYTSMASLSSSLSTLTYPCNASKLTITREPSSVTTKILLRPSVPRSERIEHSEDSITHLFPHQWHMLDDPLPLLVISTGEGRHTSSLSRSVNTTVISSLSSETLRLQLLESCRSYNEELTHWNRALYLRKSHYFVNTPFVIPEATGLPQMILEEPTPVHPTKSTPLLSIPSPIRHPAKRRTPEHHEQAPNGRQPVSSKGVLFPGVSHVDYLAQPKRHIKLRHPTKVHKRDLTVNTLKIYLKHYMDNQTHGDWMTSESSTAISDVPTKRRRTSADPLMPRPAFENRPIPVSPSEPNQKSKKRQKPDPEAGVRGLTMSYLRRVPELRLLAERIVAAEDKKKRQEARQTRETAKSQGLSLPPKTEDPKSRKGTRERAKRLFRQAIIKLCDEGTIVLWDGPRRMWDTEEDPSGSCLWHTNTTVSTVVSSIGVSATGGNPYLENSQDHEMSESDPNEESYVSLTPAHLGKYVEKAIEEICSRKEKARGSGLRSFKGPTLTEILSRLKADGRWRRIGECAVAEALQWLKDEERVWEVGGGHWELTI